MWQVYTAVLVVIILSLLRWRWKRKSNITPKKNSIYRHVSNIERYSVVRNEIEAYYGFSVAVRLHAERVSQRELETSLRKAAFRLFREFKCLTVALDDPHASPPEFVPLVEELTEETIPFEVVQRVNGDTVKNVLVKEHNRKWDARKVLWRIILVVPYDLENEKSVDFEVVFSPHHVIADGISGLTLLRRLLEHSCSSQKTVFPKPVPLSPPLESVVDIRPGTWFMIKVFVIKMILPNFLASLFETKFYAGSPKSLFERKGCLTEGTFITLDQTLVDKLTIRCREEKTTVHGSLAAALLIAIEPVIPKTFAIKLGNAINIRNLAFPPLTNQTVGVYVAGVDIDYHKPLIPHFWTLARDAKQQLNNGIKDALQMDGMFDYLEKDKWEAFWNKQKENNSNGRFNTIAISNLGVWNLERKYGDWQVLEGYFSQCNSAVGTWIQLSVVTVHSQMCVSVTYSPVLCSQLQIQQFIQQFQNALQNAIQ